MSTFSTDPVSTQQRGMAMTSAAVSSSTFAAAAIVSCGHNSLRGRKTRVVHVGGLNSFGGLKADANIASLGLPKCTNQSFAMVLSSLKSPSKGRGSGGGAPSSTCSAAAEIFKIAAIMNGLVLIGVAVGFVLLRVEASVEEAE